MKPLKTKLLVKLHTEDYVKTAKSGLFVCADEPWQVAQKGIVLETGEDTKDIQVGDTILFPSYKGTEFRIEDNKYLIIKEEEVLAQEEKERK